MIETLEYKALSAAKEAVECARQKGANMDDLGNAATKAWGVLQEHGIFAAFLWLAAQGQSEHNLIAKTMWDALHSAQLVSNRVNDARQAARVLERNCEALLHDLGRVMLARRILEQVLLYLRYSAKAHGESGR